MSGPWTTAYCSAPSHSSAASSTTDSVNPPIPRDNPQMREKRRDAAKADVRDQAAYGLAEAAHYVKLPTATLRSWVAGRAYPKAKGVGHFQPLIHPPKAQPLVLSFWNLIESHVLRALRTEHGVTIK